MQPGPVLRSAQRRSSRGTAQARAHRAARPCRSVTGPGRRSSAPRASATRSWTPATGGGLEVERPERRATNPDAEPSMIPLAAPSVSLVNTIIGQLAGLPPVTAYLVIGYLLARLLHGQFLSVGRATVVRRLPERRGASPMTATLPDRPDVVEADEQDLTHRGATRACPSWRDLRRARCTGPHRPVQVRSRTDGVGRHR